MLYVWNWFTHCLQCFDCVMMLYVWNWFTHCLQCFDCVMMLYVWYWFTHCLQCFDCVMMLYVWNWFTHCLQCFDCVIMLYVRYWFTHCLQCFDCVRIFVSWCFMYGPSLRTVCNVLIVFVFLCRDALCMVLVYSLFAMFWLCSYFCVVMFYVWSWSTHCLQCFDCVRIFCVVMLYVWSWSTHCLQCFDCVRIFCRDALCMGLLYSLQCFDCVRIFVSWCFMYGPSLLTVCNVLIVFGFFAGMLYAWYWFRHVVILYGSWMCCGVCIFYFGSE